MDNTAKIRELNDKFRSTRQGGRLLLTSGIQAFGGKAIMEIIGRVMAFDAFTEDNDPHGEHDFGAFEFEGQRIFWKIDYYDLEMRYGSEDPTNPAKTRRVLTIMLADEY